MADHPSDDDDLRAFLAGPHRRDPRLGRRVVRSLLEGGSRETGPPGTGMVDYDDVLARAEQTFSLFFAEGKPVEEPPGVLLAELVPASTLEELGCLPSRDLRRAIPTLTKWLIARSHAARFGDPKEMLHWGLMGRLAADSCPVRAAGSKPRLADLKARAWGQFGNALRVCGRFREAGEVLTAAREYLEAGTGDIALRARLYEQMASLQINQRSLSGAMDLVEEAAEIYEEIGDRQCLAGSLMQKAIALVYACEPDRATRLIDRAIALLDPVEDPDLLLAARINRAHAHFAIDRSERALSSFRAARNDDWHGRPAMKLRASWLEGQILSGLGYLDAAETALCSARRGFIERDLAPEVVAASRDLAGLYRKMGKRGALERTVLDTQARFFGIPAEVEVRNGLRELERMVL